ncbi:MAG: response regulator [Fibrobacterota bacterium]
MSHKRVLLIEDDSAVIRLLQQILESRGYVVTALEDGRRALDLFRRDPFDLVITDIIMPDVEGMEIIMTVKGESPETPIIAISGGGRIDAENYLVLARDLDVSYTFKKPFKNAELVDAVHSLIGA